MDLSLACRRVSGAILITVPSIEWGGSFLLRSLTDPSYTGNLLRQSLFRAGHAHAGVIVILSLVCQVLLDGATLPGIVKWSARIGMPLSAILVSAGFFFSALAPDTAKPGDAIYLVLVGEILLGGAVLATGVGLLRRGEPYRRSYDAMSAASQASRI